MNEGTCKWISVEERLPSHSKIIPVIDYVGNSDRQSYFAQGRWWRRYGLLPGVAYWLEVIPPPSPKKMVRKEGYVVPYAIHSHKPPCDESVRCVKVTYEVEE